MNTVNISYNRRPFFFIVNVDWFFLSHRLPLALAVKEKGYRVFILTKDSGYKSQIIANGFDFININFERSGKNIFREILIIKKLVFLFKKYRPEIVHNVTIKPTLYSSIALRFINGQMLKCVNAISGLGYNFINDRQGIVQRIIRKMMKFAYQGPVHFIFQNSDDMMLYKRLGFLHDNNYIIIKGAGVDTHEFSYVSPIKKEKAIIVIVSRMLIDKGIYEFIQAAKLLKSSMYGRALFLLIGDIDENNLASLNKEQLKDAEIPGYLEWHGFKKEVKEIFINSDIVCLPSYREGLPKCLIEAMAIGRPIVTTDVPGCRECVDEGKNGFLVPAKDPESLAIALMRLIDNPELRLQMGKASRQKMVRELSLELVIDQTLGFYEKI